MRKTVVVLTSMLLLLCAMAMTASAAVKPEIIKEPQNLVWPEGSDAFYTVDAYGDNLNYKWFIVCGGVTYDTTQYEPGQPWTNFSVSGSNCDDEGNTFYFNGILPEANGAVLYCEVTGTGGAIRSQPAVISVGGSSEPPQISVVAGLSVSRGDLADIYCSAFDPKGGTLEYMWYETPTGKLRDITAIGRGSETSDTLHCNTEQVGTRYFVCMVSTSNGGIGYSSVIPVTVTEQNAEHKHQFGAWMVTTEPTCTESGIKVRECECGYTERDGIPAAGHQWDAGMATKEPTIDTVGVKTFTCTVCGETKSVKSTDVAVDEPSGSANSSQTVLGTESTAEPAEPLAGGETQTSGLPTWSIVLVAVVAAGGGAAVTAFIVKKKNVDRAKT